MKLEDALARLNSQLPLKARQEGLTPALKTMHRQILVSLVALGRPPSVEELKLASGEEEILTGLQYLGSQDLVVLDNQNGLPLGAYPITSEPTPHRISINGHDIYAMCALDAVAVAPMFETDVRIDSSCHVSHTPIMLRMRGSEIIAVEPGQDVMVGIRWQMPTAIAAHSMCLQMVFLKDIPTALAWQAEDTQSISLFELPEAVQFGKAFFLPLLV